MSTWSLAIALTLTVGLGPALWGCSSGGEQNNNTGLLGQPCLPEGGCHDGLICNGAVCVDAARHDASDRTATDSGLGFYPRDDTGAADRDALPRFPDNGLDSFDGDGGNPGDATAGKQQDAASSSPTGSRTAPCEEGTTQACATGIATEGCKHGQRTCENGSWTPCEPPRADEMCDKLDNDCDGEIDNNPKDVAVGQVCGPLPNCPSEARWACVGGKATCRATNPQPEVCDGMDNNCDGPINNISGAACPAHNCQGQGRIATYPDNEVFTDKGTSAAGDSLEFYCCWNVTRICLSYEACPWRSNCGAATVESTVQTCSRAGIPSGEMLMASGRHGGKTYSIACNAQSQASYTCRDTQGAPGTCTLP